MKIRKLLVVIICIVIAVIFVNGCSYQKKIKVISSDIELNLDDCIIEKEKDSHGGFLGDGDYFARISCSKIDYDGMSANWKELPLSMQLKETAEMKQCDDIGCRNIYEKFSIPDVTNGYYYFLDRHIESKDIHDDLELNNRSSWNFTLAILDKDSNIIYYYELDT